MTESDKTIISEIADAIGIAIADFGREIEGLDPGEIADEIGAIICEQHGIGWPHSDRLVSAAYGLREKREHARQTRPDAREKPLRPDPTRAEARTSYPDRRTP